MSEVFPEPEYKLRLLPPEHPIWHAEEPVDPQYVRPLWGIDIGCRTSVVFCPDDLSCYWELARPGREQPLARARSQAEVAAGRAIGVNVLAYATNRELKYKFENFTHGRGRRAGRRLRSRQAVRGPAAAPRRLQRGAGGAAEPAARGRREAEAAGRHRAARAGDLRPQAVPLPPGVHARPAQFPPDARRAEATAARIWSAAACCSPTRSARAATSPRRSPARWRPMFPEQQLERIPPSDPLFTHRSLAATTCRASRAASRSARAADGPLRSQVRAGEPYLEGHQAGRSLRRDLLALRHQLRAGEPRVAGMRRLHPQGRRPDRPERAVVFVSPVVLSSTCSARARTPLSTSQAERGCLWTGRE